MVGGASRTRGGMGVLVGFEAMLVENSVQEEQMAVEEGAAVSLAAED